MKRLKNINVQRCKANLLKHFVRLTMSDPT